MRRRRFLALAAGAAATSPRWATAVLADDLPADVKITRITGLDLTSRRVKFAGKNARLDVHGDRATDRMVRLYASNGLEGIGNCRASEEALRSLLGQPVSALAEQLKEDLPDRLSTGTMPVWDLLGKLRGKPVYELLGNKGPQRVPVYDGSIYFQDLLPPYTDAWQDRFRTELDDSLARGHRAVKVKIGRGSKWMPRTEGDARDLDVVRTIRQHVGPEFLLGVDANNGYDPFGARHFLNALADVRLAFAEEMFPETLVDCESLRAYIAEQGWPTLIADGETQESLDPLRPLIEAHAIDIAQADMNRFGIEGILTESKLAEPNGVLIAPHNWGSLVGYYLQLHVGRAIPNFYRAENDPLVSEALVAEGYVIADGTSSVPNAPGFGLTLRESALEREAKLRFDLRA